MCADPPWVYSGRGRFVEAGVELPFGLGMNDMML